MKSKKTQLAQKVIIATSIIGGAVAGGMPLIAMAEELPPPTDPVAEAATETQSVTKEQVDEAKVASDQAKAESEDAQKKEAEAQSESEQATQAEKTAKETAEAKIEATKTEAENAVNEAKETVNRLEKENEKAPKNIEETEKAVAASKEAEEAAKVAAEKTDVATTEQAAATAKTASEKATQEATDAEAKKTEAENNLQAGTDSVAKIESAKQAEETALADATGKKEKATQELTEAQQKLKEATDAYNKFLEEEASFDVTKLPEYQAVVEAQKKLDTANAEETAAKKALKDAKDAKAQAESLAAEKATKLSEAENALNTAKTAKEDAENALKNKQTVETDAKERLDNANLSLTEAEADLQNAKTAKEAADKAKETAEAELAQKTSALSTAKTEMDTAKTELDAVNEKVKEGMWGFLAWAKAEYPDDAADIEKAIEILNKYPEGMLKGDDNDASSLRNIKAALTMMAKGNELRTTTTIDGVPLDPMPAPLNTTHQIMAIAISNADNSATYARGHLGHFNVAENLAWGNPDAPYDGWYTEEKAVIDFSTKFQREYKEAHPDATELEIYNATSAATKEKFPYAKTGHYYSIVNNNYGITGMGRSTVPMPDGNPGGYTQDQSDELGSTWSQVFAIKKDSVGGGFHGKEYTVEEYTKMFDRYVASLDQEGKQKKYDETKATYEALKTEVDNFTVPSTEATDKAYTDAQVALDAVKANVQTLTQEHSQAIQDTADAQKKLTEKTAIYDSAVAQKNTVQSEIDAAKTDIAEKTKAVSDAEEALLEAQVKTTEAKDELAAKQAALDAILNTDKVTVLQNAVQKAKDTVTEKETALNDATKQVQTSEAKLQQLNQELIEVKANVVKLTEALSDATAKAADKNKEKEDAEKVLSDLTTKLNEEKAIIDAYEKATAERVAAEEALKQAIKDAETIKRDFEQAKADLLKAEDKAKRAALLSFKGLYETPTTDPDFVFLNDFIERYKASEKRVSEAKEALEKASKEASEKDAKEKAATKHYLELLAKYTVEHPEKPTPDAQTPGKETTIKVGNTNAAPRLIKFLTKTPNTSDSASIMKLISLAMTSGIALISARRRKKDC